MKVIDLSHPVAGNSPNWEGSNLTLNSVVLATHEQHGYYARHISFHEHSATHIDAPAHMFSHGITVEKIPADRLVRSLAVIDVRDKVSRDENYAVTQEDLFEWEGKNGAIPSGAVVIALTGWAARWPSTGDYRNEKASGLLHFPAFSLEAARWLVEERQIAGLGTDTLSIDIGIATEYPVHRFCAPRGVYSLENVTNLEQVPQKGATIVVAPLKLENGSGAPVRLLALVHE